MAELVAFLARQLVDQPDQVRVDEVEREGAIVVQLWVGPEDRGKVIGRQGRIARALRTIVRAGSASSGRKLLLEIVE